MVVDCNQDEWNVSQLLNISERYFFILIRCFNSNKNIRCGDYVMKVYISLHQSNKSKLIIHFKSINLIFFYFSVPNFLRSNKAAMMTM